MLKKASVYILVLFLALAALLSCSKFQKIQKSTDWQEKYDASLKYYEKKDYYRASLLFEELIPIIKGKQESEKIELLLAYSYYYQKQYLMSASYFKNFFETYARSAQAEEGMYMYALSLYQDSPPHNLDQTSTFEAVDAIQTFINRYPYSSFREESNRLMAELRVKLELKEYENAKLYHRVGIMNGDPNYKSAVVSLANFEKNFPDSKYLEEVGFLKIDSQYLLAKNSIDRLKKERFQEVVNFYEKYVDKYTEGRFIRQAEKLYSDSVKELGQIASK